MSIPTDVSPSRAAAMRTLLVETVNAEPELRRTRLRRRFVIWGGSASMLGLGGLAIAGAGVVGAANVDDGYELVHCLGSPERG